jgi:hypothetical protein
MHSHISVNYLKMLCIQRHKWISELTEITFLTALDNLLLNRHLCVFCLGFELLYIIWVKFGLSPSKMLQFPILSTAQERSGFKFGVSFNAFTTDRTVHQGQ